MAHRIFDSQDSIVQSFRIKRPLPQAGLNRLGPFLLLDHAGPLKREPGDPSGIEQHPHRGFQALTLVYKGQVKHRDSWGNEGTVGPGGIQWMTAGSGLVHEEMPGAELVENGGEQELIQLWVNLPARHKMVKPTYLPLEADEIPTAKEKDSQLKVIAGELFGVRAKTDTFSPLNIVDIYAGKEELLIEIPEGYETGVFVSHGSLSIDGEAVGKSQLWTASSQAASFRLAGLEEGSRALLISGEPLREPVAQYGPFVMNKAQELEEAIMDFQTGKMGVLD